MRVKKGLRIERVGTLYSKYKSKEGAEDRACRVGTIMILPAVNQSTYHLTVCQTDCIIQAGAIQADGAVWWNVSAVYSWNVFHTIIDGMVIRFSKCREVCAGHTLLGSVFIDMIRCSPNLITMI